MSRSLAPSAGPEVIPRTRVGAVVDGTAFPGPEALGRGVVIGPGAVVPEAFSAAPRVRVDDEVLAHPADAAARLHDCWLHRRRVVIELAVDTDALREPEVTDTPPYELTPDHTFHREQVQFLVWANNYDLRSGTPRWWHGVLAERRTSALGSELADIVLADGRHAWVDGGPRGPLAEPLGDPAVGDIEVVLVHRESVSLGRLTVPGDGVPADELAPDQRAAVTHRAGPARIIAPAGSGKTRVLTSRLRHLLLDRGVEPELVTAVAYNTRAAAQMRDRTAGLDASVRTLHSLALWICNLDERREVIQERDVRSLLDRLVRTARIPNQDPYQPYLEALAEVRLGLRDPAEVEAVRGDVDGFAEMFPAYRDELRRRRVLDFDEQIYRAIELLLTRPDMRRRAQRAGTHLLVDEFQDLTPAFLLLVRLVAGPSGQVFAVGDDDQTIYSYAGASPRYLVDFEHWFPGAASHALEVNYRCPATVVDAAVNLVGHNRIRVGKTIRSGARTPTTDTPDAASTDATATPHATASTDATGAPDATGVPDATGARDATGVPDATDAVGDSALHVHAEPGGTLATTAVTLVEQRRGAGEPLHGTAVLARVNSALLPVQVALTEAGIPHSAPLDATVLGRTGLRTALAYLRMGLDLDRIRRDDVFDTINRPARKVKSVVAPLLRNASRLSISQLEGVADALDPAHRDRFNGYLADLRHLEHAITDGADTAKCLWIIRSRIGLDEAMDALDASRTRPEGSSHGDDLDALEQLATLQPDPAAFREWLTDRLRAPGDDRGVTLATVHRVKGMEWDHVVVFAANQGLFPHRLSDDVEEERRVFHVALTRCRQRLDVIADAARPSPFVAELREAPPKHLPPPPATASTPPASRRGTDRRGRPADDSPAEAADPVLYEALRSWRSRIAAENGVPAYLVFHDRHLTTIAARRPTSLRELAGCPGVGPTKLERYGDDLLDVIAAHPG